MTTKVVARLTTTASNTNQSLYVDTPAKLAHRVNDCLFFLDFSQLPVL
jgi:hypothetical protein